jgi:DNA-binding HxlR family transcriptional regulator
MSTTLSFSPEDNSFLAMRTGKWTLVVVAELSSGTRRFNELRRAMDGISQKTLASTLRELERDGFISRTAFATIPPRVDYALTELGQDLLDLVDVCRAFVVRNRDAVTAARHSFDLSNNISLR